MAYDSYLVQESDGASLFSLEDGTGSLLLETAVETGGETPVATVAPRGAYRRVPITSSDDDLVIALILSLN